MHSLYNSSNLYRNGGIWNAKYDFYKWPASSAEHFLDCSGGLGVKVGNACEEFEDNKAGVLD